MLRRGFLAVAAAAIAALAPAGARADWLTYGRDASHSARVDETIPAPLAVKWKFASRPYFNLPQGSTATVNSGSPIVMGDTIYFASRDRLYALDRASGEMKWRYPSGNESAPTIRSTPTYSEGVLYFGAGDGNLYALDATTGSQLWQFRTTGFIRSHPIVIRSSSSEPGTVVFGSDDDILYAINARTGELVWKNTDSKDDIASAPVFDSNTNRVYFSSSDMQVHAVDLSTGKQRWVSRTPISPMNVSPVLYENRLFMPAGTAIYAFRLGTGTQSRLAIVGSENELEADISSSLLITPDPDGPGGPTSGLVYFGDHNGNFYAVAMRGSRVQRRWKVHLDAEAVAMPVLVGDTLYVGTHKGFVYALNAKDGTILWAYRGEAPRDYQVRYTYFNISAPLVADNGQLLVLSDDGTLTCFTADAIDGNPPVITAPRPDRTAIINGTPPVTLSAYMWDDGSGINPSTVSVYLDGRLLEAAIDPYYKRGGRQKTGVTYDPLKKHVEYNTPAGRTAERTEPLSTGRHVVKIEAADWKGNVGSLEWAFMVDNTLPVRKRPVAPGTSQPGAPGGNRGYPGASGYPGGSGGPGMGGPYGTLGQPGSNSGTRSRLPASRRR